MSEENYKQQVKLKNRNKNNYTVTPNKEVIERVKNCGK